MSVLSSSFSAVAVLNLPESIEGAGAPNSSVTMTPDVAREFFKRAQWQLLIKSAMAPGQRSLVLEDGSYSAPTITAPTEYYVVGKTITAILIRAQLVDPRTGQVVAAFVPGHAR